MRIRLYFDEDSARRSLVLALRARGSDVVTGIETGTGGQTDARKLEWAAVNSRALYFFNRGDFYRLHTDWINAGRTHAGIILSGQCLSVVEQIRRLLRLTDRLPADEMRDRVEFLGSQRWL